MVESKCAKVFRGRRISQIVRRNVNRLNEVIEPFLVDVIRSCKSPISAESVG